MRYKLKKRNNLNTPMHIENYYHFTISLGLNNTWMDSFARKTKEKKSDNYNRLSLMKNAIRFFKNPYFVWADFF